jgi:hypothetical protein
MRNLSCFALLIAVAAIGCGGAETDQDIQAAIELRAEDFPEIATQMSALDSCPGFVSCPGYGSCTSWASLGACDQSGCFSEPACMICDPEYCPDVPGMWTYYASYRVCFNQFAEECVEFATGGSLSCGC